jgi:hypothetical protein
MAERLAAAWRRDGDVIGLNAGRPGGVQFAQWIRLWRVFPLMVIPHRFLLPYGR